MTASSCRLMPMAPRRPAPSQGRSRLRPGRLAAPIVGFVLAVLAVGLGRSAQAQDAAQAAQKPPVSIGIFISSRNDLCFDPGDVAAIRKLATQEQARINQQGGIAGRQLLLRFLDDARDTDRAVANMRSALADPQTIALVGLANSARAKAVFDATGRQLRESAIPYLSDIAINSIFAPYANVFTTRASQDDERLPVLTQFMKHTNARAPAFVGIKGALFSNELGDGLRRGAGEKGLVADHRLTLKGDALDAGEVAAVIADLEQKQPDLLFLSIGSNRNGAVMRQMIAAGVTPPLFITGRIESIPADVAGAYPSEIYQLAWDGLPDVYNDRLRKLMSRSKSESWVFEGTKVAAAPGWRTGGCKPRPDDAATEAMSSANLRAIGIGTQFADMVALVAAAARVGDQKADVAALRAQTLKQLKTTYASGRGTFQGSFENWSFGASSRAAARTPLILMQAPGLGRAQLAPIQFVRLKNGVLRRIDTLYADIDLIRAFRIDDNEKSFYAEFYLSMRDTKGASIEQIEFANGFLDPRTNDRQLTVRTLHKGGRNDAYPDGMKIYQVAGKFTFEPQLGNYPFDTQRFSIDIQPKLGDQPFIVQPPPEQLRDQVASIDGWIQKSQYVGYDEDFVPTIDAKTHEPSIVPFYKASFVWLLKRQTTDYYLRVVVPLAFILIVAYLAIFIPQAHFEAIVTIQVTALLSAFALYIALPKVDADAATLSDRIFLFDYMAVSLMIVISIMRVNRFIAARGRLKTALGVVHVVVIPMLVALMAFYVYRGSLAEG